MKLHEIYGLPTTATIEEINTAAAKHAKECAEGKHGSVGPVRVPVPSGIMWSQSRSEWVPKEDE